MTILNNKKLKLEFCDQRCVVWLISIDDEGKYYKYNDVYIQCLYDITDNKREINLSDLGLNYDKSNKKSFDEFGKKECVDKLIVEAINAGFKIVKKQTLEQRINDPDWRIRLSAAKEYNWNRDFVYDEHPLVRAEMARNGCGLDVLKNDPNEEVRKAANNY